MMTREVGDSAWVTLTAYARVVRRRAWVVILVTVLVTGVAIGLSKLQDPVFEASASVLVSAENATLAAETQSNTDPVRYMQTQARLARTTAVARRTLESTNPSNLAPEEFLGSSSVRAEPDSDLLVFSSQAPVAADAMALANAYARSYTQYRNALDTVPLERALAAVTDRIAALKRAGQSDSALYASLVDKRQQLQTIEALKTDSATVVQTAVDAPKIKPQTGKRAQLALVFGLFAGLGLAFLLEAADRRLRSPDDIPERLHLPILGRIPPLSTREKLPTMTHPSGPLAEAYRILRMNIEYATAERNVRTVMVTSAMAGEGKTTTAANLAITLARAGRSVVLVDADFIRPAQADLFSVAATPGLVQVARRETQLARALTRIGPWLRMPDAVAEDKGGSALARLGRNPGSTDGTRTLEPAPLTLMSPIERRRTAAAEGSTKPPESNGLLRLLATEEAPLDLTEAMVGGELRQILDQLETDADLVIVDAPPLGTSVTLGLGPLVDAILVVANAQVLRESTLDELAFSLEELPGQKLGLVLTAVDWYPRRGYGYRQLPYEPTHVETAPLVAWSDRSP